MLVRAEGKFDTPRTPRHSVEWPYNALVRRIRQTTSFWTNDAWQVIEDLKFVSDPMLFGRHIAELNASDDTLVHTYVWGLDLNGTMGAAGGVGGLLWVNQHTGSSAGVHFCAYDGNGNVVALVSANTGTETARYEYGLPQLRDEPIGGTDPMSKENPVRFSTKRTCNTTDLVLYEYRAYSPRTGRWLSRDPIDDLIGHSGYVLVGNSPTFCVDNLGLETWMGHCDTYRANYIVGVQFVDCNLRSRCTNCRYNWVVVKAAVIVGSWPLPFNVTGFTAVFETPSPDPNEFAGWALVFYVNVVTGQKIVSIGHLYLGNAEMVNSIEVKGLDVGLTGGVGRSWVKKHGSSPCRS